MIGVPAEVENGVRQRPAIPQNLSGAVDEHGNAGAAIRFGAVFEPVFAFLIDTGFLSKINDGAAKQASLLGIDRVIDHALHRGIVRSVEPADDQESK